MKSNEGYWPEPTADFDWCELKRGRGRRTAAELWNSVTSLLFCVGPFCSEPHTRDLQVRLNLALVVAIGAGLFAFHATLQYRDQLLDELPMITYIAHTVAMLSRKDSVPARAVVRLRGAVGAAFATAREDAAHRAGRVVMVLSFSGCFVWLAGSLATVTAARDKGDPGGGYVHTRRYQSGSLTVLISIVFWVTDNMGCASRCTACRSACRTLSCTRPCGTPA